MKCCDGEHENSGEKLLIKKMIRMFQDLMYVDPLGHSRSCPAYMRENCFDKCTCVRSEISKLLEAVDKKRMSERTVGLLELPAIGSDPKKLFKKRGIK